MSMNNVNVNLTFTADTSQAKAQLETLQTSLRNITNSTNLGTGIGSKISADLQQGIKAAAELQVHLKNATNVNTGNLDFSKLSQSLQQSGMSLEQYGAKLRNLGPQGQQAFQQLANSVAQSEIPLRRTSTLLTKLGTTLANTIRWQISSRMLYGFIGSIQSAFNYAKDLNENLNNIRIVTGQNVDQMAKFADEANRSAKELSTTTNAYAKASLIFYQQGLKGTDVTDRANVVMKMANVTKEAADDVSSYMTAIWNNFDDGSKSLEYYADVLTKLGATTASSTAEISGGLEKFASIGKTVGLSYEYAASALATITAKTRQSEDVVGTALKTIFSRIEGLKLGETLEDGTDLNKYSEALLSVGVNIKDQQGNLKDMDSILDEIGAKWEQLNRDQQVALAQSVGGIRQYNQFISLMDNWDFMEQNVETARNASGELQKQADIYAESWDAASNRVKAALEEMYSKFIDDKFFINLTKGFGGFIELINNVVDTFGGLKGVLMGVGVLLTNLYSSQIAAGLVNMVNSLKLLTKTGREALASERAAFISNAAKTVNPQGVAGTAVEQARGQALQHELQLSETLRQNAHKMTDLELERNKILMDGQRAIDQRIIREQEELEILQQRNQFDKSVMSGTILSGAAINQSDAAFNVTSENVQNYTKQIDRNVLAESHLTNLMGQNLNTQQAYEQVNNILSILKEIDGISDNALDGFLNDLKEGNITTEQMQKKFSEFRQTARNNTSQAETRLRNINNTSNSGDEAMRQEGNERITNYIRDRRLLNQEELRYQKTAKESKNMAEGLNKTFLNGSKGMAHWSTGIVSVANSVMSLGMAFSSIQSAWNTIKNPDMSGWEKALSLMTSLGMAIPMLFNGFSTLANASKTFIGIIGAMNAKTAIMNSLGKAKIGIQSQEVAVLGNKITALTAEQIAEKTGIGLDQAKILLGQAQLEQITLNTLATKGYVSEKGKELLASKLGINSGKVDIFIKKLQEGATWKQALAEVGATGIKKLFTKETWNQIKANAVLIAQFIAMLWPIWAIIGAIALLVVGIKLANDIYNKDAKAAEEAAAAASKAAESFKNAQQAYDDFKSTVSNYKEAVSGLAQLTKGTIEYKEQIMKANEEALKLINSQDLLYGKDYKYNEDGLIEFTKGTLENIKKQEFNNLERQQANRDFTAQRAKTAEEKANLTEFARNNLNDDSGMQSEDWGSLVKGASWAASGAAIGATLGTIVPVIGNAVGAIGGAIIGGIAGLGAGLIDVFTDDVEGDSSKNELESMRKLAEAYDKKGEEALTPDNIKEVLGENNSILDDVFAKPTAEMAKALIEEQDSDANYDMEELNDLFAEKGENITPEDLKAYFEQNGIKIDQASIDQMFQSVIDPEVKSQIASLAANTAAIRAHVERTAGTANQDNEAYQRLSEEDQSIASKIIANRVDDALADKDSDAYAQLEKDALAAWQAETQEAGKTVEKGFFKGDETTTYDKYMEITYGKYWKDNYKVENMTGTNATIYQKNEEGKWENIDPDDKKNTLSNDEVKEALVEYYAKQYSDADAEKLAEINTAAAEVRANVGGIGTIADQDIKSAFASGESADLSFMTKEQVDELKAELENGTIKVTDEYKKLLLDGADADAWSEAAHEARMEEEANSVISEGASKYELDEEALKVQAKMLQQTHKGLEDNAVTAAEMAVANQRLNKGVKKLSDGWKDWSKTLKSSDKTTQDYAEAVVGVQDAMRDMFGLTEDAVIPEDFLQDAENLNLLDQIANGSEEAAQKLHFNLTKAQIEAETFSTDIKQNMINAFDFGEDTDFEATFNEMKTQALNALNEIQGMANGVDIGAGLKDPGKQAAMAKKLNEYAKAAGWTADQMQSALSSVGVRAKITMVEGNPVTKKVPRTHIKRERVSHNPFDNETEWVETTWVDGYEEVTEPTLVPQVEMEDPNNPSGQTAPIFEKVDIGNIAPSSTASSSSGGGNSKATPNKKETTQKSEIVERYKEVNKALETQAEKLEELNELYDNLWGQDRIDAMDMYLKELEKEDKLIERKLKENANYIAEDRQALVKYGVQIDEDGNVTNVEEIQKSYYDKIAAAEAKANEIKNQEEADEYREKYVDPLKEEFEEFTSALESYEEEISNFFDLLAKERENELAKTETIIEKNNAKLELNTKALDKLSKKVEKAYGAERFEASKAYREKLEKDNIDIEAANEKNKIESETLRKNLGKYGAQFNKDGQLINDLEIQQKLEDATIEAESRYGVSSEQWRQAKRNQNQYLTWMQQLGKYNTNTEENLERFDENTESLEDSKWEDFDYYVELKGIITEVKTSEIEMEELFLNEDADWSERLGLRIKEASEIGVESINDASENLQYLLNIPVEERTTEWFEQMRDQYDTLTSSITETYEMAQEAFESYREGIEGIDEKVKEAIEDLSTINDELEHFAKLLELVNRETDYDSLNKIYEVQYENAQQQLNSLINYRDNMLKPEIEKIENEIASGSLSGDLLVQAEKDLEVYKDLWEDTNNQIRGQIETVGEIANQIYENSIAKSRETFEKVLTDGFTIEELMNNIERLNKSQEETLTKTNQLYETQKIIKQAQLDMDKTDSLFAKQKYQQFIKQTEQLANQEKMSKLDLEIAQQRYSLLQAQIALEEAQKTKDSMRLVRGADGNWDYVYTANQDKIAEAEAKVAESENNLYNLGLEKAQEYNDKRVENWNEYLETIAEINEKFKDDEKRKNEELEKALEHHYGIQKQLDENYFTSFDLMVEFSANGYADYQLQNISSAEEFKNAAINYQNELMDHTETWQTNMETVNDAVGDSYFETSKKINDVNTAQTTLFDTINNTTIPGLKDEWEQLQINRKQWQGLYTDIMDTIEAEKNYAKNTIGKNLTDTAQSGIDTFEKENNIDSTSRIKKGFSGTLNNNISQKGTDIDYSAEMIKAYYNLDENLVYKNSINRNDKVKSGADNHGVDSIALGQMLIKDLNNDLPVNIQKMLTENISKPIKDWDPDLKNIINTQKFDTGGYTGAWGPQGKFAMLHQKELVLNASDTENMLAAVGLVRELSSFLDNQALAQKISLLNRITPVSGLPQRDALQQEVNIHAEFPNVTNHLEIEEALNNIVNDAVQYVNME